MCVGSYLVKGGEEVLEGKMYESWLESDSQCVQLWCSFIYRKRVTTQRFEGNGSILWGWKKKGILSRLFQAMFWYHVMIFQQGYYTGSILVILFYLVTARITCFLVPIIIWLPRHHITSTCNTIKEAIEF